MKYDFEQNILYREIADEIMDHEDIFVGDPNTYTIALFNDDSEFVAVALYGDITDTNCQVHLATVSSRWATRETLRVLCTYPFLELGVKRVTAPVKKGNWKARDLVLRMGFVLEGELRDYHDDGESDLIFGMLRDECRWI